MWKYNYGLNDPEHNDELMHYGVLGMKWGKRKSFLNTSLATYANRGTSKFMRKRGSTAKANKSAAKAKKSDEMDRATTDLIKSKSTGRLIAGNIIRGPYGNRRYHELKTQGVGEGRANVQAVLEEFANSSTVGLYSLANETTRIVKDK